MAGKIVDVLSAGAVEPGLIAASRAFEARGGDGIRIEWATTPAIRKRIDAGEVFDLLIVPKAALDELAAAGRLIAQEDVALGRVGVGVAARTGMASPDVSSPAAFEHALLEADSIVFTRATSGIYVESLLRRLDLHDRLLPKITRFTTGPQMMAHLIRGSGREICLGAVVELLMFRDRGVSFAGPLPAPLQHFTAYHAAPMKAARQLEGARAFLRHLGSGEAKAMFAACGVALNE